MHAMNSTPPDASHGDGQSQTPNGNPILRAFHIIVKPMGPVCNLACSYCFYREKDLLYPSGRDFRMNDDVLETFIRQYLEAQEVPEVVFGWQGGEPSLLPLDFFRKAVEIQQRFLPSGMRVVNAFQTNGTLLDDQWCRFFKENDFLVGISLDGPEAIHDKYRKDRHGRPTFKAVMQGLDLLHKYSVEHNALCVVHRHNSRKPMEVYGFFKEKGFRFIQFIPLVEKTSPHRCEAQGNLSSKGLSEASVQPLDYGRFLCAVYDEWVAHDVGRVYVQTFESAFASFLGKGSGLCLFDTTCGRSVALEHNGDLYSCDHFVFPRYRLGNICEEPLTDLLEKPAQLHFGNAKRDALPSSCRTCDVLTLCRGECPKNRFVLSSSGKPNLNYLCPGLKLFFHHAMPTFQWMAHAYRVGSPPSGIMEMLRRAPASGYISNSTPKQHPRPSVGRNAPCPCGSGIKYKRCCGNR